MRHPRNGRRAKDAPSRRDLRGTHQIARARSSRLVSGIVEAHHRDRMRGLAIAAIKFSAILSMPPPELTEREEVRFHLGYLTSEHLWGDMQIDTQSVDMKLTDVPFHLAAMMLVPLGEYIRLHPKQDTEE